MIFIKKNRFKPYYKKFVNIGENIKNSRKILKFKKKKMGLFDKNCNQKSKIL